MDRHAKTTKGKKIAGSAVGTPVMATRNTSTLTPGNLQQMANSSEQVKQLQAYQEMANTSPRSKELSVLQAMANTASQLQTRTKPDAVYSSVNTNAAVSIQRKPAGNAVIQRINGALDQYLNEAGYTKDRNYRSFHGESPTEHVGWKAHVGADVNEGLSIAKAVDFLKTQKIDHKFDISDNDKLPIAKFLTVYPPKKSSDWKKVIHHLEDIMGSFGGVDIEGELRVISGSAATARNPFAVGKVSMRHGQNTNLTAAMVEGKVERDGTLGTYKRYKGNTIGSNLPLLSFGNEETMFFSKTNSAPAELKPTHIFMAIYYNNSIIPDKREEANPAKAPLPAGVSEFDGDKLSSDMVGSPQRELSPIEKTMDAEEYNFSGLDLF